jgi:hypothetical protein
VHPPETSTGRTEAACAAASSEKPAMRRDMVFDVTGGPAGNRIL